VCTIFLVVCAYANTVDLHSLLNLYSVFIRQLNMSRNWTTKLG